MAAFCSIGAIRVRSVDRLIAFLGIALLVIVTPGPDTALTVRNVLRGGRREGLSTAVGVTIGQLTWAVAAVAGLAALLRASEAGFLALRICGAGYLAYLGALALRDAVRGLPTVAAQIRSPARAVAWRQGLLSNLANPKMGVFFLSLLPQFAGGAHPHAVPMLALGALFAVMTLVWLAAYCWIVGRAGDVLRRRRPRRAMDAVTGTALIGLSVRLAAD
jgi:threonine/homoserine/homoserine lactone efflux protein